VVVSRTGIFANILTLRGDFAVLKREFPVALLLRNVWNKFYEQQNMNWKYHSFIPRLDPEILTLPGVCTIKYNVKTTGWAKKPDCL